MQLKPFLLEFPAFGIEETGMLSVVENGFNAKLPFEIQRVVWTYNVPSGINRGYLAHIQTGELLIAVKGKMVVSTETLDGEQTQFVLDRPTIGLYVPPKTWHYVSYSEETFQLSLASHPYDANDYVRDYKEFKKL
ncbi:MAG: FdtA/QdtA family cupin domain-containing protein [Spirosomataceae bacterium]